MLKCDLFVTKVGMSGETLNQDRGAVNLFGGKEGKRGS